jgi:hypothetical protein
MLYTTARISTYWSKKMKKLLALLVTTVLAGAAQSATITLDDFSTNQGPISDLTNTVTTTPAGIVQSSNGAVCDNNGTRTICSDLISTVQPTGQATTVTAGIYDVRNDGGENSIQTISWILGANSALIGATNASFLMDILYSDGNPITLNFTFAGSALAPYVIPGNTTNTLVPFGIPAGTNLAAGGVLTLKISGLAGWDLGLDSFGLSFTPGAAAPVPAPALPLIFGAGLIALALRRKQK